MQKSGGNRKSERRYGMGGERFEKTKRGLVRGLAIGIWDRSDVMEGFKNKPTS